MITMFGIAWASTHHAVWPGRLTAEVDNGGAQKKMLVEVAIREKTGVRTELGPVELKLDGAAETDP